jgi:hypothetical protein
MVKKYPLEDFKINVKIKLAALWAAVVFCYIYGDFFALFVPGKIQSLMDGKSGVGTTTPQKLLMFAILMTLPSIMVFLSVALKATLNRWLNIVMGIFFTAIMILVVATSISDWMIFYTYLGIVEILITSLIVWYAWKWPRI